MVHKKDTSILTRFLLVDDSTKAVQTGKTVTYEIRKPDESVADSGNMSEITGTGIYYKAWTPDEAGWWIFKISCSDPVANDLRAYFVESGLEKDIMDMLENATYGLSSLEELVDDLESRLTAARAGYLDNLSGGAVALEATLTAIKGAGWSDETLKAIKDAVDGITISPSDIWSYGTRTLTDPNSYKADVSSLALEATLTAIKGDGWSDETLKAIKDAVDGISGGATAQQVWEYGTRTLTDPNSYKADVSALALEATLSTHDSDIKGYVDEIESLLKDGTYGLSSLETLVDDLENMLKASPATDSILFKSGGSTCPAGKSIWNALGDGTISLNTINNLLTNETYGLSALETLVDEIESLLKDATYGLSKLETLVDDLEGNVSSILTDTGDTQPRVPRITSHMDFWSDSQAATNLTDGGESGVVSLPDVVVAGLPAGVTITRVVAMIKIAMIKDTSGDDNKVDVATGHVEVQKGGAGGYATAINIPENAWSVDVSEATERGGDVMIGDNDLGPSGANKVDGNATYNFEFDDIGATGTNLQLVDVMVGLRVYFTP